MPELGVDGDATAVAFHDHLHHVETEAHPGDRLHGRGSLKRLEDLLRHPRIDAWTAVDDLEVRRIGHQIVADAHLDRLAAAVLDGVGEQVWDDLIEAEGVRAWGGEGPRA